VSTAIEDSIGEWCLPPVSPESSPQLCSWWKPQVIIPLVWQTRCWRTSGKHLMLPTCRTHVGRWHFAES